MYLLLRKKKRRCRLRRNLEPGAAQLLEHGLGVVLVRGRLDEGDILLTVSGDGVLVLPGVVEVRKVLEGAVGAVLLVDGIAQLDSQGQELVLVGGGVDGDGDEPHDGRAIVDVGLQAEHVTAVGLAVVEHGLGDGLEHGEDLKVGLRRDRPHLGHVLLELQVDGVEDGEVVGGQADEPVGVQTEGRRPGEFGNQLIDGGNTEGGGDVGDNKIVVKGGSPILGMDIGEDAGQGEVTLAVRHGDDVLAGQVLVHVLGKVDVGVEDGVPVLKVVRGEASPHGRALNDGYSVSSSQPMVPR